MATRTQVVLTDDIDGGEATQTINFALQGTFYEIDLNDDHASALQESFADWIASARRTPSAAQKASRDSVRSVSMTGPKGSEVRQWLREQGYPVTERGRIAMALQAVYDTAH